MKVLSNVGLNICGGQGQLPAQSKNDNLVVSDWRPVEMAGKEGGFRDQRGLMVARPMVDDRWWMTTRKIRKSGGLPQLTVTQE